MLRTSKRPHLVEPILEQRCKTRYRLHSTVEFSWQERNGVTKRGTGGTGDISSDGVFVVTSGAPPVGSKVQLEVTLPKFQGEGAGTILRCEAQVVRCEAEGFAAVAELEFGIEPGHERSQRALSGSGVGRDGVRGGKRNPPGKRSR